MIASGERLAYYEGQQWQILPSFHAPNSRGLLIDGDTLWVGSEGRLTRFKLPLGPSTRPESVAAKALEGAGEIWALGKSGDQIVVITREDVWLISADGLQTQRHHLPTPQRLIVQDWKDRVLILQSGKGLWEVRDGRLEAVPNPLPDPSDTTWHGSDGTFIFTSKALYTKGPQGWTRLASTESLSNALITSVTRWEDHVVATTYTHGLALFDLKTGQIHVRRALPGLDNPSFLCSYVDRQNRLWLGMRKGIALLESLRFGHTLQTPAVPVLAARDDTGLLVSYSGRAEFWPPGAKSIAIDERVWSYLPTRHGPMLGLWGKVQVGGRTFDTAGNIVLNGVELPDGDLVVTTGEQVYRVDPVGGTSRRIETPPTVISGLTVHDGMLWAAGSDGNLYRSRLGADLLLEKVSEIPGRGDSTLASFQGVLLVTATNSVRYGELGHTVVHTEGLHDAKLAANADGLWLVGRQDGFQRLGRIRAVGDRLEWETVEAKGLAHLGEIHSFHGHEHLLTLCGDSTVIELRSDELQSARRLQSPDLTFTFTDPQSGGVVTRTEPPAELKAEENGLTFSGTLPFDEFGERPRYQRRLRPSESTWQTTRAGEEIGYPSLSPRSYTLEVRATHLGRTGNPATYAFTVPPPWYATLPAAGGYVVVAALVVHGLHRLRTHNLRRRTAELERTVEQRTRALAKASAAKSEFLASMSHEIRNPMNGVLGLVEILRDQPATPRQADTLRLLHHCADQLRTTVDDILDFSKIEAGRIELESTPFDLREALEAAAVSIDPKGERIRFIEPPPSGIRLVGDLGKLRQIFANYLSNALKYGVPPGARVSTFLTDGPDRLQLTLAVASSGPSIPKDTLDQFFESFTRGNEAIDRNIRGTGLGLAICRRYAQAMGGEVGAVSANGETTFYLNVPFQRATAAVPTDTPAPPATVLPAKALAIEDEGYNRIVLANILQKMNYTVDWATTGEEALRLAKANGYDVIFTDYRLPDTNGVELTRKILKLCRDPSPAVFAVTAYSTKERREECLSAGMAGFISKPITLDKLRTTLAGWAEGKLATISLETSQHTLPVSAPASVAAPVPPPALPVPLHPTPALSETDVDSPPASDTSLPHTQEIAGLGEGWDELEQALHTDPHRAATIAHRLNNLCRAHGLIDAAEQLELLEGALERGEPAEPFLNACAPFLEGYCSRATVVNPAFNA